MDVEAAPGDLAQPGGTFAPAAEVDLPAVAALMNAAYRGEGGWCSEADFMGGDRTSAGWLAEQIAANPAAALLVWRSAADWALLGSVWLEPKPAGGWYLGSLTVDPARQDQGLGRALLARAEDWVRAHAGREIEMSVINIRDPLIAWYERRGYRRSGETRPFPYGDDRFGVPKRPDLEFVVLRKRLDSDLVHAPGRSGEPGA